MGLFYRSRYRVLIVGFAFKLAFIIIEVALVIGWVASAGRDTAERKNAGAVLEWSMFFIPPCNLQY